MSIKKISLIVVGVVAGLFIALFVLATVLITPERVRDTVLPLAEDALERKIELGEIEVSLFSGISLQDVAVKKKGGQDGQFIAADKIVLRYSLLALLMLKVEVDEVTLVTPQIEIIRNRDGTFNFSDLSGSDEPPATQPPASSSTVSAPIDLHISKIGISDGHLLFIDHLAEGKPARHEVKAFNLAATNVSTSKPFPIKMNADWNGNNLGLAGNVDIAQPGAILDITFNKIKVAISGSMSEQKMKGTLTLAQTSLADLISSVPEEYASDLKAIKVDGSVRLALSVNDDVVNTSEFIVDINQQVVNLDIHAANIFGAPIKVKVSAKSDELIVDKILPPGAPDGDSTPGKSGNQTAEEIGPFAIPLDFTGEIRIARAVYNEIPVTDLMLQATLRKNILRMENLQAAIAGGTFRKNATVDLGVKGLKYTADINLKGINGHDMMQMVKPDLGETVEGLLSGEMQIAGAGTLAGAAKKNLSGVGTFRLEKGKLQNIPALNSTAALLGVGELREVVLDDGEIAVSIKDGKVSLKSTISGPTTRLNTSGNVGLDGRLDLRSQLALSPELGGRLHEQGKMARYLGDDQGWTTVPIRVKGSYDAPDVGLDSKGLKKQAEKAVKKEVQKKLEKELQKKLKGLFGQ